MPFVASKNVITTSKLSRYIHLRIQFRMRFFGVISQISLLGYSTFYANSCYTGVEWNVSSQGILIMSQEQVRGRQPLYTQIDVSPTAYSPAPQAARVELAEQTRLLRDLVSAQDRQNELLEELVSQLSAPSKQRATELGQWKQANPHLARSCRAATEALGKVQTEFLETLTQEISVNYESFLEGEFMLNEFVDRFGPRMAHLNSILQVLSQLARCPTRLILQTRLEVGTLCWASSQTAAPILEPGIGVGVVSFG